MSLPPFPLDPTELSEEIGIPLEYWPGNCHGIAEAVLRKAPCPGMRLVRGHYTGHVSRESVYRGGVQQHSWLQLEDGRILDPTRWAMDRPRKPYIYCGANDAYDEAGMELKTLSRAAMAGSLSSIGRKRPEDMLEERLSEISPEMRDALFKAAGEQSPYGLLAAIQGPVEHLPDPERLYREVEAAGLKAWVQVDNWVRVMEPEKVSVPFGINRLFEAPAKEPLTDHQVLFKTFCRFLSIEARELRFEEELEEYGISLEEFHDALNDMEKWLKIDPDLPYLPSDTRNVISLAALDLLGKGFGTELRVERYAASLGLPRLEFDRALQDFGRKAGMDLSWIYPPIDHAKRDVEKEKDASPSLDM